MPPRADPTAETPEHFAIGRNRKGAPGFLGCRIFCAEPAAIPDRGRGHASAENAPDDRRLPIAACFGMVMAFVFVSFTPAVLNDGDTYWHIAAGSWMLEHHALLRVDPFSYTFGGKPWQVHEWLSEILMALAYRLSGWDGIVLLSAIAFAASAGLLLGYLGRFLSAAAQGAVTVLALACGTGSLLARPHLLALPILTFWTVALLRARDERRVPSLWLTPLIALWANLHDSYLVGLALIAVFALEAIIEAAEDRPAVLRGWAVFAAVSAVMALATPFGISGILFPLHLMSMPSLAFVGEWQVMDFSRVQPLEACIAALGYVWVSRGMKVPAVRVALLAVLLYLAVAHVRHGMIAGIIGAAVLAKPLGATLRAGGLLRAGSGGDVERSDIRDTVRSPHDANRKSDLRFPACASAPPLRERPPTPRGGGSSSAHASLLFAAGMLLIVISGIRLSVPIIRSDDVSTPLTALGHVPAGLEHSPVLNDYAFGGYLIFNGIRPFVDSRAELYGDSFLRDYARIIRPDPAALAGTLARRHIAWTIFGAANPAAAALDRLGWRRTYSDRWAVVHVPPSADALNAVLTAQKPWFRGNGSIAQK